MRGEPIPRHTLLSRMMIVVGVMSIPPSALIRITIPTNKGMMLPYQRGTLCGS